MNGAIVLRMKPPDAYVHLKSGDVVHVKGLQVKGGIAEFLETGRTMVVRWQNGEDTYIPRESIELIHVGDTSPSCMCEGATICD